MRGIVVQDVKRVDADVIRRLGEAGVATVHEANDRLGLMGTRMHPRQDGKSIAGSAITVLVPPGDNWMIHVAIEQVKPGDILVVAPTSPNSDGYFGDLLATSAKARGCAGIVIDGGVRDLIYLRQKLDFPIWSTHVHAQGCGKKTIGSVNVPIVCADAAVEAGDVIVADDDGVCVVRRENAERVVQKAEERFASEEARRKRFANGELGLDIYNMRDELKSLGLRYVASLEDAKGK
jgi:4-hydroxy-4-methyl-2-oxoglutarate aldolase